jgi:DNA-binding transcriptional LysR family regulator
MRIRQIEAFHAIYLNGSISSAARVLNVSQPSLTKVLKHAESQLGFPLFRRVKGRLVPTDEAHVLFREVNEVHDRLASLRKTARNLRSGAGGHISAAVLPALGIGIAPAAIARFRREHPEVTFDVMTLHHDEVLRCLYERLSEFAVVYEPAAHPRLKVIELAQGELVMLHRRDQFSDLPPRIPLSWFDNRDIIGQSAKGPVGDLFTATLNAANVTVREVVSVHAFYMAAGLVRHGAGISVIDQPTAVSLRDPSIDFRPLDPPTRFRICALYLEDRPLSQLAERFLATFRASLQEALASGSR